jgi:hypothetical protein
MLYALPLRRRLGLLALALGAGFAIATAPGVVASELQFSAIPVVGKAPLEVTFLTYISGFRPRSISYVIDFGDGTSEKAADCPAPADACQAPGRNVHTYQQNGVYTATLTRITDPCAGRAACREPMSRHVAGRLQVWVGTVPVCTKEYRPVCGAKPVVCIKAPCDPVPTTYGNRCEMNADGAAFLHEGTCRQGDGSRPRGSRRGRP